jgi:hypothetical protein
VIADEPSGEVVERHPAGSELLLLRWGEGWDHEAVFVAQRIYGYDVSSKMMVPEPNSLAAAGAPGRYACGCSSSTL